MCAMRVTVVGTGYVGLVSGASLAATGLDVWCVDQDPARVEAVRRGDAPFHEPSLDELLRRTLGRGLSVTTDLAEALQGATVVLVAVGTPTRDGQIDLSQVADACRQIGALLDLAGDFPVVVIKSTVVPGTTRSVVRPLLEEASGRAAGRDFGVAVNPEFLTEGTAVADFMEPDRIVIGADDQESGDIVAAMYRAFPETPLIVTNTATAEMIKYASNTLLATMISFSNEIANLGAAVGGIDVEEVMDGVHASRYLTDRGGPEPWTAPLAAFLRAGCGYGGSCLPKDTRALIALGESVGEPMPVLRAVQGTNDRQPARLVDLVERHVGSLAGARVAVLGLAFKPDTDDVRESPAFPVIHGLLERGAIVVAHDPVVAARTGEVLAGLPVRLAESLEAALVDVDAAVIVTRWAAYRDVPRLLADRDPQPAVVDGRRMLDPGSVRRYAGIGR
jgi:UDPglucose 6-dehydrogenase